jgi:hypothetical protein
VTAKRDCHLTVRIDRGAFLAVAGGNRPRGGVTDRDGLGKNFLHPLIRRELPALHNADAGRQPAQFRVEKTDRLLLNHVIQFLVELEVVRVNLVERHF